MLLLKSAYMTAMIWLHHHREIQNQSKIFHGGDLIDIQHLHNPPKVWSWFIRKNKPRSKVPLRYLSIVLTPTQCLLVGATLCLASKFTANVFWWELHCAFYGRKCISLSPCHMRNDFTVNQLLTFSPFSSYLCFLITLRKKFKRQHELVFHIGPN
jgi:hypothetical protein